MEGVTIHDEAARRYIEINYGPCDRLRADDPFIAGAGAKPAGANFYPCWIQPESRATSSSSRG